ncbi:hypothetical protein [Solibacillus sp. FSL W8-0372]|uniref:hypothetical protein n=1 Tax=Solibacillus sp. FSL W8-0372 TaxID=2921713 RepID=UPI0030D07D06
MNKILDLILNIVIIFLYIFIITIIIVVLSGSIYYFYKDSDTLLAGIIAFVGAIIGGSITYLGVIYTVNENKKESDSKQLVQKSYNLAFLEYQLQKLYLNFAAFPISDEEKAIKFFKEFRELMDDNIIEKATIVDISLSKRILNMLFLFNHYEGLLTYKRENFIERNYTEELLDTYERFKKLRKEVVLIREKIQTEK